MSNLLNDVCRCHDDDCPKHETCLRWLDRKPKEWRGVVHTKTLRKDGEKCMYYMEDKR